MTALVQARSVRLRKLVLVLARLVSRADLSASRIFENRWGRKTHCGTLRVPPRLGCGAGCWVCAAAMEKMRVAPASMGAAAWG